MTFEPLSRTRLFEDIVEQVLDQIKSGDLKPGDKLPSERDLAEMLNVSRNSLREALRALEMMNFIEIRPGEGAIVKEVTISELLNPVTDAISIDQQLMLDLLDVREIIEIETARRAAINGTEEDFKAIRESIESAETEIQKMGGIGLWGDRNFHKAIINATHNRAFMMIFILINDALVKSMSMTLTIPGQPLKTLEDHRGICEAICRRDSEKAASLMKDHIEKAKENILMKNV